MTKQKRAELLARIEKIAITMLPDADSVSAYLGSFSSMSLTDAENDEALALIGEGSNAEVRADISDYADTHCVTLKTPAP